MIRCLAIDDEPLALIQLTSCIEKTPFLELVKSFTNALDAITLLTQVNIDLIFIDINMPDLNGLDFVKMIPNRPMIVFTTAYSEYAVEGFKADAIDYLLKPYEYTDFLKAANKAMTQFNLLSRPAAIPGPVLGILFVKSGYKICSIDLQKILYIESQNEYARIVTDDNNSVMTLTCLKSIEERLPSNMFIKIHRSYIIRLQKITEVSRNRVRIGNILDIPVGEQYKEAFTEYLNNLIV